MMSKDSTPSEQLQFAVIAIETAAQKLGISTAELTKRLQAFNLVEDRLWKYYDFLHTQSSEYVADDLIEALESREVK
ncbi:MAG: DUF3791 domain-containing protein [Bacteroidales bacterium]|nr:DUF3791 domain-containing protein [Bacteroidales bacterium]